MSYIYLLTYNNYYNRIVKQENDLAAYLTYQIGSTISGVNFNPNDGVDTELIIGKGDWSYATPDYLIVSETSSSISSRWFVLECSRTRGGQYKLTLHRDVIVDNYDEVITADCFIDKAKVSDSDIAIYNKEDYVFNKIKREEFLLKDNTNCAWIVGYCSQKDPGSPEVAPSGDVKAFVSDTLVQYQYTTLDDYFNSSVFLGLNGGSVSNHSKTFYGSGTSVTYRIPVIWNGYDETVYQAEYWYYTPYKQGSETVLSETTNSQTIARTQTSLNTHVNELFNGSLNSSLIATIKLRTAFKTQLTNRIDNIESAYKTYKNWNNYTVSNLMEEEGKLIKDTTNNKYYIVRVRKELVAEGEDDITTSVPSVRQYFNATVNATTATIGAANCTMSTSDTVVYKALHSSYYNYVVALEEIGLGLTYTFPSANARQHLIDAPYDMFCMPFDNKAFYDGTTLQGTCNKFVNFGAAMSMVSDLSGVGYIYDLQLLPYCPLDDNYIRLDGGITIPDYDTVGTIQQTIGGETRDVGWFIFCQQSKFEFPIEFNYNVRDIKQEHQTDNWRFNSPNWSASYDFDMTMNKGVSIIDVDCTYKPYSPYIHICPRFNTNGLYGLNNNDAIGLICAGDFSLPIVTDQWKTYEYQNKNYQQIFDRQIQNMDTNYRLNQIQSGVSGLLNTATGAAQGAFAGSMIGGTTGMGIGAAVGGITSLGGLAADMAIGKAQYQENKSYATDTFNYQINNIKSLPNTLSKVSAFNANNKLFPFIEYFTCTDQEKTIFSNLLKYNGMTVNRVDKIETFLVNGEKNFTKGRLIRIEDIADDYHMASAIANEIAQGVYI